ncbi:hypothetical protein KJS94_01920 [Flavihumibacter rivuli]|uniref:MutS family DNA mismatch repair protein n=1 Tax=Flavihumibacter rivuli TaxID=2838156 RepID=UPI001BDE93AF|nr:MutS family DNA mismatch repair protein [Flavihumibacter rivuli]ULQ56952.1 hypothetical protein KJS94_01920 [Flavihumibacter rivuli]
MINFSPLSFHKERVVELEKDLKHLNKKRSRIAWIRLVLAAGTAYLFYRLWPIDKLYAALSLAVFLAIFLRLVVISLRLKDRALHLQQLLAIHKDEQEWVLHRFQHRYDGSEWQPEHHAYARDLDLFGRHSVYQLINRAQSEQGRQLLAKWLLEPAMEAEVLSRQEAIRSLSLHPDAIYELQAIGASEQIRIDSQLKLEEWLAAAFRFRGKAVWSTLRWGFPILSLSALTAHLIGYLPGLYFYPALILFMVIAFVITKKVMPQYQVLDKMTVQLKTLLRSARHVESLQYDAPLLMQYREAFMGDGSGCSTQIRQLQRILDRFDYRLNPLVFLPLNTFLLWDLQQVLALERWKEANQERVSQWYAALAGMEALYSLGCLAFNKQHWAFPKLSEAPGVFSGRGVGHPLIAPEKRVANDFMTEGKPRVSLITGSNMAGKSTFLRSIGINQVLAMMGAPVCAEELTVSPMRIMSSMRVTDNLEENASTFYAELHQLKGIIDAVNEGEQVLVLLDEILRGTNSNDRHTGSRALIRQLVEQKATALLATHDLELAKLSGQYPEAIRNYHFDVQVAGEELYFDYRLKPGVCTSMNASILMKKIGIDL